MAVQTFLMAGHHAEIAHMVIRQQLGAEQTGGVLDKDRIGGIQLGKRLFVLAFDHNLRFRRNRAAAQGDQILEPQAIGVAIHHDRNPCNRALRMRRGQLPARRARMFAEFQRTRAGRGIDIVQMHDLLAHAVLLHQLQRNVVILIAFQPRAQALHLVGEGKPHLDSRVKAVQIGHVVIQRGLHHLKAKGALGVFVKGPHDAGHVDALLLGIQANCPRDRGLQRQVRTLFAVKTDRQAEIGNAHMLNLLFRPPDQAGGAVLQIGQRGAIGGVDLEPFGVVSRQRRVVHRHQPRHQARNGGIKLTDLGLSRGFGPFAQSFQRSFGLIMVGGVVNVTGMHVHRSEFLGVGRQSIYGLGALSSVSLYAGKHSPDRISVRDRQFTTPHTGL